MPLRLLRIAAVALVLAAAVSYSQQLTLEREGQTAPGIGWALGVLSLVFLVRAAVTERMRGPEASLEKDLLWGLGLGGVAATISIFTGG